MTRPTGRVPPQRLQQRAGESIGRPGAALVRVRFGGVRVATEVDWLGANRSSFVG
jgi:hypothetical protein